MTWRRCWSTPNVNSIVAFALGGKDAQVMRREFLQKSSGHRNGLEPVPASALIELSTGEAYAKFAGGHAIKLTTPPPIKIKNAYRAEEVAAASWERYAAPLRVDQTGVPSRSSRERQNPDQLE
jgi:hypothetical protein